MPGGRESAETGAEGSTEGPFLMVPPLSLFGLFHAFESFILQDDGYDSASPAITLADLRSLDGSQIGPDLAEALRREKKLKSRVQELVATLEKLSKNSEIRHQQSAEFVNDLKKANRSVENDDFTISHVLNELLMSLIVFSQCTGGCL